MPEPGYRSSLVVLVATLVLILLAGVISGYLKINNWAITTVMAMALGAVPLAADSYSRWKSLQFRRNRITDLLSEVHAFASGFVTNINYAGKTFVGRILKTHPELERDSTFDPVIVATGYFIEAGVANRNLCDQLAVLALCDIFSRGKGPEFSDVIRHYADTHGLVNPSDAEAKQFLSLYNSIFLRKKQVRIISQIDSLAVGYADAVIASVGREFLNKYAKNMIFDFFETRLDKSEDLRRTLATLVREGRLPTIGVWKKAVIQMQKALEEKQAVGQYYLIIANETGRKKGITRLSDILSPFTRIGAAGTATHLMKQKAHRFGVYLVKTAKNYASVQDFIRTEIEPKIQSGTSYLGLTSVYRLNVADSVITTFPRDVEITNANLIKARDILNVFKEEARDVDLLEIIGRSELDIDDLLSVLPLNLLVPGISESERSFIVTNYEKIRKAFNVKKLPDWRNADVTKLAGYITGLGRPKYDADELKSLFGIDASDRLTDAMAKSRFELITSQIVTNANRYNDALQGIIR